MSAPGPDRGNLDAILATAEHDRTRMNSSALGAFSLVLLGVASVVGAGIFVVTGDAAAHYAGPAVLISFILAGIVAGLTALCYAELASMIPAAGSTYSYAFAAFGSFVGWFIGWDLLLEYLFAASTVAVGWSGYFVSLMDSIGVHVPHALVNPPFGDDAGVINLPAMAIMLLTSGALWLGTRESAVANNAMVLLKLGILILVVGIGVFYVTSENLTPFLPAHEGGFGDFGWSGVFRGAGIVFFAYIGFDAVSTAAAEARNPRRTIPIGLLGTVLISTVLYIAVGFVLTGMLNYRELGVADPIAAAIHSAGPNLNWLLRLTDVARRRRSRLDGSGHALRADADLHADVRGRDAAAALRQGQPADQDPAVLDRPLRHRRRHRRRPGAALGAGRIDLDRDPARLHHRLRRRPHPAPPLPRPAAAVPGAGAAAGRRHRDPLLAGADGDAAVRDLDPARRLGGARPLRLLPLRPRAQPGADGRDRRRHHQ
jgi:amino acid permease-like protein